MNYTADQAVAWKTSRGFWKQQFQIAVNKWGRHQGRTLL